METVYHFMLNVNVCSALQVQKDVVFFYELRNVMLVSAPNSVFMISSSEFWESSLNIVAL